MATVTFEDERTKLIVTVRPATYHDDLNRLEMQEKAVQQPEQDAKLLIAAAFTYPRLICSSPAGELTIDGKTFEWPPSLSAVMDMSVDVLNKWYNEVARLNPAWFPDPAELEKKLKEMKLQTESSPSTKAKPKRASRTPKR